MMPYHNTTARIETRHETESLSPGQEIYLSEQYYQDTDATVLEVPRYGWKIKAIVDGVATIEYQRPNWKLLMSIMCETKYLRKEL